MTSKDFLIALSQGKKDIFQSVLEILEETGPDYCLIGGLAVNAYAEPVVSLDIDLIIAAGDQEKVGQAALSRGWRMERFPHSLNLASPDSDLRIQLQTDPRYQEFVPRAVLKEIFGYTLKVAEVEDVLQGKVWAFLDPGRRKSKRQKDLADIFRLVEAKPELEDLLPEALKTQIRTD
jgi:hypothetical protein